MPQLSNAIQIDLAHEFLTRSFTPGETLAILLRGEYPVKTQQRIVRFECAVALRYLRWLAYENTRGANIYVAANPLRFGSRKRTKESIDEVRHLIYRYRLRWRGPLGGNSDLRNGPKSDDDLVHISQQIPGPVAGQ